MFTGNEQNVFVLGGMFFEEFYGQFYANDYGSITTAQVYVGQNSQFSWAYIGNQELEQGKNPFIYHAGFLVWQWSLIAVGGFILIALLAYGVYLCVKKKQTSEKNQMLAVVYSP